MNADELRARLATVEQRLEVHAAGETPGGLTDPDPGGTERWEAGDVWAHMAEFPGYWVAQLDHVIAAAQAGAVPEPIPFGRTKTDAGRIAAIERDRDVAPAWLLARVHDGIAQARGALDAHHPAAWDVRGLHATLGEMPAARIFEHFIVAHLEEHASQLDALAESSGRTNGHT